MVATYVREGRVADLNLVVTGHGGNFVVGLFTNSSGLDDATTLSTITPPTFPGYTAVTPTFSGSPSIDANGNAFWAANPVTFTQSADDTPQDVYGSYLYDSLEGKLLYWDDFVGGPQTFQFLGDFRTVTARLYQGPINPPL